MDNLAVSLASDVDPLQHRKEQRTALTLACVIGFAFPANYINHAPLVGAPLREFDFNRNLAGLLTTGIFTTHAMLQVPGGHLADWSGSFRSSFLAPAGFSVVACTAFPFLHPNEPSASL